MVGLATLAALGGRLAESGYGTGLVANGHVRAVKAPVFSMGKLRGIDPYLGPEMKSTGEEMGIAPDLAAARSKAFASMVSHLVIGGTALLSLSADDVEDALPTLAALQAMDIVLMAAPESRRRLVDAGLNVMPLLALNDGPPDAVETIRAGYVQLVFTTANEHGRGSGFSSAADSYDLRRAAVERQIPCITSIDTARALVEAIAEARSDHGVPVATVAEYVKL